MPRSASKIGVALAVVALVASLLVVLLRSEPRYAGSNSVRAVQIVAPLTPGRTVCEKGELVPEKAATVEVSVATAGRPGPPLAVELRDRSGRVLARGSGRGGYRDGVVGVPIPAVRRTLEKVDVCLRAMAAPTAQLYGQPNGEGKLEIGGKPAPGVFRIAYKRPGSETWLSLAPTIAHRFSIAKTAVATPVTFWLVLVLVAGAAGLAIRETLRGEEP